MNKEASEERKKAINNAIEYHKQELVAWERVKIDAGTTEKPELEHGDYGMDWIVLNRCDTLEWFGDRKGVGQPASLALIGGPRIGKFFADLKALAEPLKEFELSETYISGCLQTNHSGCLHKTQIIRLTDRDEVSYLSVPKVRELILYLQRLVHTAEQEQNAKP